MPHCGITLARVRNSFFVIERSAIARDYTAHDVFCRLFVWMKPLSGSATSSPFKTDHYQEFELGIVGNNSSVCALTAMKMPNYPYVRKLQVHCGVVTVRGLHSASGHGVWGKKSGYRSDGACQHEPPLQRISGIDRCATCFKRWRLLRLG